MKIPVGKCRPHPAQPPFRWNDTVELQESIGAAGLYHPIKVCDDGEGGYYILSGVGRWKAHRSRGEKEMEAEVVDVPWQSPVATRMVLASNVQKPMSRLEKLHVLRYYEKEHLVPLQQAGRLMGLSVTELHYLAHLAKAPLEVQEAIERHEKTGGKEGLAFSAWKEIATELAAVQLKQLDSGRVKLGQVKRDKRKRRGEMQGGVQDDHLILGMVKEVHEKLAAVFSYMHREGRSPEILAALRPVYEMMKEEIG